MFNSKIDDVGLDAIDEWNTIGIPFIHLFVRLALEFNSFDEEERGGLLINNDTEFNISYHGNGTILKDLAISEDPNVEEELDTICLTQLIRLRQSNILMKEDIVDYSMVCSMLAPSYFNGNRRFYFLVEWNPTSLIDTFDDEWRLRFVSNNSRHFRLVFDIIIRYFPKTGITLLFRKIDGTKCVFELACEKSKRCDVMNIVEDILARYSNIVLPIITETLFLAAVDDDIHLNGVYFLLRRLPAVIGDLQLPPRSVHSTNNNDDNKNSRSPASFMNADIAGDENGSNGDNTDHENDDNNETNRTNTNNSHRKNGEEYEGILDDTSHTGKRKRK